MTDFHTAAVCVLLMPDHKHRPAVLRALAEEHGAMHPALKLLRRPPASGQEGWDALAGLVLPRPLQWAVQDPYMAFDPFGRQADYRTMWLGTHLLWACCRVLCQPALARRVAEFLPGPLQALCDLRRVCAAWAEALQAPAVVAAWHVTHVREFLTADSQRVVPWARLVKRTGVWVDPQPCPWTRDCLVLPDAWCIVHHDKKRVFVRLCRGVQTEVRSMGTCRPLDVHEVPLGPVGTPVQCPSAGKIAAGLHPLQVVAWGVPCCAVLPR
jgi:hypothetical protein